MRSDPRALSADAELATRLAGAPLTGAVHSVFARTINLEVAGRLITLAVADVDDAPATVRVSASWWAEAAPGDPLTVGAGALAVAGHTLTFADASWWRPQRAGWTPAGAAALASGVAALDALIPAAPPAPTRFLAAVHAALTTRLDALAAALASGRPDAVRAAADALVGLGQGLTPSGDDALTGALLVATTPGSPLARAVAPLTPPDPWGRTSRIAAEMLDHAGRGRFRASLLALADALATGADATPPARAVAAIGSSSGTDLLSGVRAACGAVLAAQTPE